MDGRRAPEQCYRPPVTRQRCPSIPDHRCVTCTTLRRRASTTQTAPRRRLMEGRRAPELYYGPPVTRQRCPSIPDHRCVTCTTLRCRASTTWTAPRRRFHRLSHPHLRYLSLAFPRLPVHLPMHSSRRSRDTRAPLNVGWPSGTRVASCSQFCIFPSRSSHVCYCAPVVFPSGCHSRVTCHLNVVCSIMFFLCLCIIHFNLTLHE
jgi:hypothetical protein